MLYYIAAWGSVRNEKYQDSFLAPAIQSTRRINRAVNVARAHFEIPKVC